MGVYSYSQPSQSEDLFGNNDDSDYSETEDLIRRDQAELSLERRSEVQYPPQPEVEFGCPQVCYCGSQPLIRNSRTDPGKCSIEYVIHVMSRWYVIVVMSIVYVIQVG